MPSSVLCKAFVLCFYIITCLSCSTLENSGEYVTIEEDLSTLRRKIVLTTKQQIGAGYKYAAKGPNRFDCSGLVAYVHRKNHLQTSGSSEHLSRRANGIPVGSALPGDLIFFKKNNEVFHVSIITKVATNALWVVHSTSSKGVIEQNIQASAYWQPKVYKVISLGAFTN